jgi:hypothetical protein
MQPAIHRTSLPVNDSDPSDLERRSHIPPGPPSGFRVQLSEVTLADLVQMQCLGGSKVCTRITSGDQVGYAYFRDGNWIHAELGSLTGEAAGLAILSFIQGDVEVIQRPWPATPSITCNWQLLLLRAAQLHDERAVRVQVPRPEAFASERPRAEPPAKPKTTEAPTHVTELRATPIVALTKRGNVSTQPPPKPRNVRLDARGQVLATKGVDEDVAGAFAYAFQLAVLLGDGLGLDDFRAAHCRGIQTTFAIVAEGAEVEATIAETPEQIRALDEWLQL